MSQLNQLAKAADGLSPEMQTRLQKLMDQCISGADENYDPLVDWYQVFESRDDSA